MNVPKELRVDGGGLPVDILAGMAVQIPAIIYDIAAVGIVQIDNTLRTVDSISKRLVCATCVQKTSWNTVAPLASL